jgi:hypothetical protein
LVTAAEVSAALSFVIPSELRISYTLLSETTTYAAFFEESRTIFTETTKSDRKSGGSRGTCSSTFGHSESVVGKSPPLPSAKRRNSNGDDDLQPTQRGGTLTWNFS